MKRLIAVLLAAVVGMGTYAMTATGGQMVVSPSAFKKLKKKVTKLQRKVSALQTAVGTLQTSVSTLQTSVSTLQSGVGTLQTQMSQVQGKLSCINTAAPLTEYGDPAGSFGYVFDDGLGGTFDTTALDFTASGDPVDAWVAVVDSSCVSAKAPFHSAHLNLTGTNR